MARRYGSGSLMRVQDISEEGPISNIKDESDDPRMIQIDPKGSEPRPKPKKEGPKEIQINLRDWG